MITPAQRTARKQLQRDRATIQLEAAKVNSSTTSEADKDKAIAKIAQTVVRGTNVTTTGDTTKMLGTLAVDLIKSPATVIDLGVQDAIKLKVSAADAASIPAKVVERLKKLV